MVRDEAAIVQTFRNYVQSFQSLEPRALVPYFQLPCLFISDQGVRVMANAGELQAFIAQLMESLKGRGFARSEVADMRVSRMSENIALVSVRRIRHKTDGSELERLVKPIRFARSTTAGNSRRRWCMIRVLFCERTERSRARETGASSADSPGPACPLPGGTASAPPTRSASTTG
jgi:hypothetical protein